MNDLITKLRQKSELRIAERSSCWEVRLTKSEGLVFEITVPKDVLEWFVTARQTPTGEDTWSDWMDYYSVNNETDAELASDMQRDIEQFVDRLNVSTFRILESRTLFGRRRQRLEWKSNGDWQRVSLI
jgi:hypothetical protein